MSVAADSSWAARTSLQALLPLNSVIHEKIENMLRNIISEINNLFLV